MPTKTASYKIRFEPEDRRRLDEIARHYAISAADVIRLLIKRESDAIRSRRGRSS